jgi:hypothetical protein
MVFSLKCVRLYPPWAVDSVESDDKKYHKMALLSELSTKMAKMEYNLDMSQIHAKHDNLPIPAYKFLAVEQRYLGATSKQIAQQLWEGFEVEVHPGTIRNWFAQSGELRTMYDDYASEMNDEKSSWGQVVT